MNVEGPSTATPAECEVVLRSLPRWFGVESSLLQYVRETEVYPTFVVREGGPVLGFLTVREHFPEAWEVHCVAVQAACRNRGFGRALQEHVERWLATRGVRLLQVKTIASTVPSPEYAETRRFYAAMGYLPVEVFPELWRPEHPVLQLVKPLQVSE